MRTEPDTIDHTTAAKDAERTLAQREAQASPEGLDKGDKIPSLTERLQARQSDQFTKHAPDAECGVTGSHPYDACGKVIASQARANAEAATRAAAIAENEAIEGNGDAPGTEGGDE